MNCPYCNSNECSRKGYRTLADGTKKQRFKCNECNRLFSLKEEDATTEFSSSTYEEKNGFINIVCASPRVLSVEDILDQFNIDEDVWKW